MFQLDWCNPKLINENYDFKIDNIKLFDKSSIKQIQYTFWAEHCVECSAPKCYKTCELYEKRSDDRCKRTVYGQCIVPIKGSMLGYGVRLKFKKWAKLETYIFSSKYSLQDYLKKETKYKKYTEFFKNKKILNPKRLANSYNYWKITRNRRTRSTEYQDSDIFLFEFFSLMEKPFSFFIEGSDKDNKIISRISIAANPGFNSYTIPYKTIAPDGTNAVRIIPSGESNQEIIIINAEFLSLLASPAKKAKCVVWDLDNTIWDGILSEVESPNDLRLKSHILETLQKLDERGVIHSIVSKNEYGFALEALKKFGIDKYFLYPKINWNPKSENIKLIAEDLNINVDTFVFVDDSPFEREEVKRALPQVRVYDENIDLLSLPEFDLIVTDEAKHRREMYKAEENRKNIQSNFGSDYISFLKDCDIRIVVQRINDNTKKEDIDRCYELINRTNQLNISGNKYSEGDFKNFLDSNNHVYFSAIDKYGSYGIVGYFSYSIDDEMRITVLEFALSCRVAKKRIEKAVLSWIFKQEKAKEMMIKYVKTAKNAPIRNSLEEAGFYYKENGMMTSSYDDISTDEGIIKIETK